MAVTNTPNMGLPIPGVGTEPGPNYGFEQNSAFTLLDQHDHSPGRGIQITPAGLNINTNLPIQGNSITQTNSVIFQAQGSPDTDLLSLYVAPGLESPAPINDLWFTDGVGNQIQLTSNGEVNATIASLPGESFAFGTFFWKQGAGSTTPANFDIGSVTIRPNVAATTFGVTLSPPAGITSQYTISLPLLPPLISSPGVLTIDNSGVMSSTILVTGANIASQTITDVNIALNTITPDRLAFSTNLVTVGFGTFTPSFVVRAATVVAGTLASSFHNASIIDGITLATNDAILIKNQVASTEDGVYIVQSAGAPVRSTSYNTAAQINFAGVHVQLGTVNANTNWFQNDQLTTLADPQSWSRGATQAFTVPAGVNQVLVTGYGGGGGGGGVATFGGGGGGGGAPQGTRFISVTPGAIIPITQGVGGVGGVGPTGPTAGASGTPSTFGNSVTFLGGGGGAAGTATNATTVAAGAGGYGTQGGVGFNPGGGAIQASNAGQGNSTPEGLGGSAVQGGGGGGGYLIGGAGSASGGIGGAAGSSGGTAADLSGAGGGGSGPSGGQHTAGQGGSGFIAVTYIQNA